MIKIFVVDNENNKTKFKPKKIRDKIMEETGLDILVATNITRQVVGMIKKNYQDEISTSTIRSLINAQLVKRGLTSEELKSRKLGMSVADYEDLIQNGCNDNANISYSPEMISKYAYDSIAKEYALLTQPTEQADTHIDGLYHEHDLEFYNLRPNCLSGNNNIIIKDEEGNISYTTIKEFVEEMFLSDKTYYVPSLNVKTNGMEWKRIENAYLSSPSEETYLVTFSKGYTIECTSDHKFIKSHNNKAQNDYDIKVSEFDNYKDLRLCNITDLKENNNLNDYNESALFGFFLGDGYISNKGNLKFSFSKKDKAEYLYHLLKQLNIEFTYTEKESDCYDTGYLYSFYIKDRIYPQLSKSELIKKCTSKYNLTGILEGLINSDGHIRLDINNVLRLNFTNTNKSIFDLYQLCLISNGIRGSINITEFDNPNHKDAYNSSSFGEKLLSLLSSMNICNRFVPMIKKANPNMKKYDEIGELKVRSIEYTGTQPVYNLTIADNHNYLAGIDGFVLTQNCMNYDLRFFAKNGLKIDGKGLMGSVAKPAKSLEVLLNHMLQALMAGATVFSGGQGYANFNTLLSPFCVGRSYKEIKQAIQNFIFNCNMSLICRGGQVLFSSIGVDLSVPKVLADEPAICPGGIKKGTYKDYQEEADLVFRAICEVLDEKDGNNAYHRFPNTLFNIRDGDLDEYDGNCKLLHELGANNPTIYYVNCKDIERTVMGCVDGSEGIWTRINGNLKYYTFKELSDLFNADYGVTDISDYDIEVLTINDDKKIIWHKVSNFIKNKDRLLYKVDLQGNKSFICDDTHDMITSKGLNRINVLDCTEGSNLLDVNCTNIGVKVNQDYLSTLYGFWLGDGSKTDNRGVITVHKEDKKEYLKKIFELSNVDYELRFRERKVDDRHKLYKTYDFIFDKSIFNEIDLTNNDVLAGILAGCLSSDGYIRINGKYNNSLACEWVSTNSKYTKLFKYCCFNLGIKFSSRLIKGVKKHHSDFERVYISCNHSTVSLIKQLFLREKQKEIVNSVENNYRKINETKGQRIKNISLYGKGDSYCIEVNGRMIFGDDFILTAQCRTALPMNYAYNYEDDCLNTGNFMYNTLNLPLIALEVDGDEDDFYTKLNDVCEIAYDNLHHRRKEVIDVIYNKHLSDFLLQKDKETGKPLYDIDRTTITLGFCGLNECLEVLYGGGITEFEDKGIEIIEFLNSKKEEFNKRDGLRWSVIGSPAESTAHRFAEIIKDKYPNAKVQGVKGSYYLTNSSHIPVDSGVMLTEHIKNSAKFHKLTLGGNILHLWLGEVWSDAEALWKLNKKILETGTIFWAYSKVFTYCNLCGFTINEKIDICPVCKSDDVITYDRITGYYLPVLSKDKDGNETRQWNNGKVQEFKDRYRHSLNG